MKNSRVLVLLICSFFLSGCKMGERKFVSQCEEIFKEGLKSPSSYKRVEYKILQRELSRKEVEDYERKYTKSEDYMAMVMSNFDDGRHKRFELSALIKYDAANSFNALIRNSFTCSTVSYSEKIRKISDVMISINGIPYFDYRAGRY